MILEDITVCNFGLFRGIEKIQFAPRTPKQPIVLVGGLNGSGKTTLLDAINLALYGRRARISNRGSLPYEEYLRRSINNEAGGTAETSVTLRFRRWVDGREQVFRIHRYWQGNAVPLVERVVAMRDGTVDKYLTDTWAEFVEEIIPIEIAQLFFFDGEKIENFADPDTSKQLLAKAVNTLLGLDVVSRLQADLVALERRKQISLKSDKERQKITEIESQLELLTQRRSDLVQDRAGERNEVDRREKYWREAQESYHQNGGALFDRREEIEGDCRDLRVRLRENEGELREVAEGASPLLLVSDLLAAIRHQHEREEDAAKSAIVNETLKRRDSELLQLIESLRVSGETSEAVKAFLVADREERARSEKKEIYLNLSPEGIQDVLDLQDRIFLETALRIEELLDRNADIREKLMDAERKLGSIPPEESVVSLLANRDAASASVREGERRLAEIDVELKRLTDEQKIVEAKLIGLLESTVTERFEAEDTSRMIEHSKNVRITMERFRRSVTKRHANRIAALVLDSFRHLVRKESLISDLRIDPETFGVEMHDLTGKALSPDRLSAGERQLLAVSILWGLARSSGYPLPVVVDTPLGRLDSLHRNNLVENYFPQASHQVILLSTNKEIDAELFLKLTPFISHSYRLEYSDVSKSTEIKKGYFEEVELPSVEAAKVGA